MTTPRSISRAAPAKVNLALAVAPPRAEDRLHPICSWMAPMSLADELALARLPEGTASRHEIAWLPDAPRPSPIDWPIEKDLAVRAHRLLERESGRALALHLHLNKRTPVGAGLGGGSSDAATMLLAVRELFALDISDDRLRALGATLGADVPVFLPPEESRPAIVEGIGDRIERVPKVRSNSGGALRLLLVLPAFGCPTGAVYSAFDSTPRGEFREGEVRAMARRGFVESEAFFNDLAAPAMQVRPELRAVRDLLARVSGAPAHVTGSGSGLFVVIEDDSGPGCDTFWGGVAQALQDESPGCAARIVTLA